MVTSAPSVKDEKEHAQRHEITVLKELVEALTERLDALAACERKHWKKTENFLSKFGTHYDSAGNGSMFIVDRLVNGGANGIALTPQQGLIERFALPLEIQKTEKATGPYWVPVIIPESAEAELIEMFDASGSDSGADNKASS